MRPSISASTTAAVGISKLGRPQVSGIASKTKTQLNSVNEESTSTYPRKSFVRRFGVANKLQIKTLPRLMNKNPLKPSQLAGNNQVSSHQNNVHIINETIELTKGTAMNVTKPVIDSKNGGGGDDDAMDRALIRSNTFVCDANDGVKEILSITHNIPTPSNDTINQINGQLNKERTSKRSLSPIPGEPMNAAKRKLMQMSIDNQNVMSAPMPLNSTPRKSISYADARKANLTFFGAKSMDFNDPQVDQLQTFTFDNTTFEQNKHFTPDAAKLGSASSATMHGNRVFDLTQTSQQNDTFYPENRNATQTLDTNAAEHQFKTGDITKTLSVNDADGNLTKTINGECIVTVPHLLVILCLFVS